MKKLRSIAINILLSIVSLALMCALLEWYFSAKYKNILESTGYQHEEEWAERYRTLDLDAFTPRPEKLTILGIGDSFTYGFGVQKEENIFLKILEKRLQEKRTLPVTTINAGKPAANIEDYLKTCTLILEKGQDILLPGWTPDLLVLNIFINDPEIKVNGRTPYVKNWHLVPFRGDALIRHSYLYLYIYHKFNRAVEALGFKPSYKDHLLKLYNPDGNYWKQFEKQFAAIVELCQQKDIPVVVSILPILAQFDTYQYTKAHDSLHELFNESGIPYVDMLDYLKNEDYSTLWINPFDAHPNEKAHKIIGESLYQFIESRHLLPVHNKTDAHAQFEKYVPQKDRLNSTDDETLMKTIHFAWLSDDYKPAYDYSCILNDRHPGNRLLNDIVNYLRLKKGKD